MIATLASLEGSISTTALTKCYDNVSFDAQSIAATLTVVPIVTLATSFGEILASSNMVYIAVLIP
jgi:hypothetical protein